jgi:hypothetical protein
MERLCAGARPPGGNLPPKRIAGERQLAAAEFRETTQC